MPDSLWVICKQCWARNPLDRPSANAIGRTLVKRDVVTALPPRLVSQIFSLLPLSAIADALRVSTNWRNAIDSDHVLWEGLIKTAGLWFSEDSEERLARHVALVRHANTPLRSAYVYKEVLKYRYSTQTRWNRLDSSHRVRAQVSLNALALHPTLYDLSGGFYFLGDCYLDSHRRRVFALRYIDLVNYEPDTSTNGKLVIKEEWGKLKLEGDIVDFGPFLEVHDLIVLIKVLPR